VVVLMINNAAFREPVDRKVWLNKGLEEDLNPYLNIPFFEQVNLCFL
jgi:hypothetical protein